MFGLLLQQSPQHIEAALGACGRMFLEVEGESSHWPVSDETMAI